MINYVTCNYAADEQDVWSFNSEQLTVDINNARRTITPNRDPNYNLCISLFRGKNKFKFLFIFGQGCRVSTITQPRDVHVPTRTEQYCVVTTVRKKRNGAICSVYNLRFGFSKYGFDSIERRRSTEHAYQGKTIVELRGRNKRRE